MHFVWWLRAVTLIQALLFALMAADARNKRYYWPWISAPVAWWPAFAIWIVWADSATPVTTRRTVWWHGLAVGVPCGIVTMLVLTANSGWALQRSGVVLVAQCVVLACAETGVFCANYSAHATPPGVQPRYGPQWGLRHAFAKNVVARNPADGGAPIQINWDAPDAKRSADTSWPARGSVAIARVV